MSLALQYWRANGRSMRQPCWANIPTQLSTNEWVTPRKLAIWATRMGRWYARIATARLRYFNASLQMQVSNLPILSRLRVSAMVRWISSLPNCPCVKEIIHFWSASRDSRAPTAPGGRRCGSGEYRAAGQRRASVPTPQPHSRRTVSASDRRPRARVEGHHRVARPRLYQAGGGGE